MHDPPSVTELLEQLTSFGAAIYRHLESKEIAWDRQPGKDEWSLTEVMCHLRDVERDVHQIRFSKVLQADHVFLAGENPDAWVEARLYRLENGPKALAEFVAERRKTLALLEGIEDPEMWRRTARHAFFGITSLQELVNLAVRHDRAHWAQIVALTG